MSKFERTHQTSRKEYMKEWWNDDEKGNERELHEIRGNESDMRGAWKAHEKAYLTNTSYQYQRIHDCVKKN